MPFPNRCRDVASEQVASPCVPQVVELVRATATAHRPYPRAQVEKPNSSTHQGASQARSRRLCAASRPYGEHRKRPAKRARILFPSVRVRGRETRAFVLESSAPDSTTV